MNPEFGSLIWNMMFEPITADVKATIIEDVKNVITYDPRLRVDDVLIDEFENGIQIQIDLTFLPDDYSDSLVLEFNTASNTLTVS